MIGLDEDRLRLTLEEVLQRTQGRTVKVSSLKREPSPFATLFPADVLSVRLQNGEKMTLFLKHLGAEQADHPEKKWPDREVRIYENLLGADDLPVVKYYGSRWNEITKRYELFLEHINGWNLKYNDMEQWFTAAQRLAHFHAYFANQAEKLLVCEFLLRFDAVYFYGWANRALSVVAEQSVELAAKVKRVVRRYDRALELLTQQPVTLVHNDLSPKNVIADKSVRPFQVFFIDWEMAGVGCGLLDLVHLKYGLDPTNDRKMCEVYCAELAGTGLLPADSEELRRIFASCELHKTMYRLARSKVWQIPPERVAAWVSEAQTFMDDVYKV